jgi:hypothetical protein
MTFLELLLHLSPDGGDGSSEIAILVAIAFAVSLWFSYFTLKTGSSTQFAGCRRKTSASKR